MSGVSLPVTRPTGRGLVVGGAAVRAGPAAAMGRLGFALTELEDPYAAMAELARRPLAYSALVLSLPGIFREELSMIAAVKRRFPQVEVWLGRTEGRQAALDEAIRLGADGILADDGLHRLANDPHADAKGGHAPPARQESAVRSEAEPTAAELANAAPTAHGVSSDSMLSEPILTAEELLALLQEPPPAVPSGPES